MKKKLLSIILIATLGLSLTACDNKPKEQDKETSNKTEISKEEIIPEDKEVEEEQNDEKKNGANTKELDGNIENILNRPLGDYSLKFTATIVNNQDYGNVLRIAYDVNNISFNGSFEDMFGNEYSGACMIDLGYDSYIKVVDKEGNVLNPCGTGYEDEVIVSEPVYIGTIGHFAQTFFINEGIEMNDIEILFKIPDDNYKFNVKVE